MPVRHATAADARGLRRRIRRIAKLLTQMYGAPRPRREDPLDALVATVLSQNTSDTNSARAFRRLKERFPSWDEVRTADVAQVADAIKTGGLAGVKAARIKRILERLHRERGSTSLGFLPGLDPDAARGYLMSFDGVGPKTAACTLLFGCGMPVFPVDTHVLRVARRLGLIPKGCDADRAHAILGSVVPSELVYPLHVNMITHGRRRCRPQKPRCDGCLLSRECVFLKENSSE